MCISLLLAYSTKSLTSTESSLWETLTPRNAGRIYSLWTKAFLGDVSLSLLSRFLLPCTTLWQKSLMLSVDGVPEGLAWSQPSTDCRKVETFIFSVIHTGRISGWTTPSIKYSPGVWLHVISVPVEPRKVVNPLIQDSHSWKEERLQHQTAINLPLQVQFPGLWR